MTRTRFSLISCLLLALYIACGGGGGGTNPPPPPVNGYVVSGQVTGVTGTVTLTLAKAAGAPATTTTNASGAFSFSNVANGDYTLTPTLAGYTFTPASLPIAIKGGNQTGKDFTAQVNPNPGYAISGAITGAAGKTVTLTLTGTSLASPVTVTSDVSSNYQFTNIQNGDYTITPTLSGSAFAPASQAVTVSGAAVTGKNFSLVAAYRVTGKVVDQANQTQGVESVTLTLKTTPPRTFTTQADGLFSFADVPNGTYSLTATGTWWCTIINSAAVVEVKDKDVAVDAFQARVTPTSRVSGRVTLKNGGTPLEGVSIVLSNGSSGTAVTKADGTYVIERAAQGGVNAILTPSKAGYTFTPRDMSFMIEVGVPEYGGKDFSASVVTYSIFGRISGVNATVPLSVTGKQTLHESATVASGTFRDFTLSSLEPGEYWIRPELTGYAFTPHTQKVTVTDKDVTGVLFEARTVPATRTLSGVVTGTGGNPVDITLTGDTKGSVRTDRDGAYTIPGLAEGTYGLQPYLAGYAFEPMSRAVELRGGDKTGNDFVGRAVATLQSLQVQVTGLEVGRKAVLHLSGGAQADAVTNETGLFTFYLPAGAYKVTPELLGTVFTPPSQDVTLGSETKTVSFTAAKDTTTYSISGKLMAPMLDRVRLELTKDGQSNKITVNRDGTYLIPSLSPGAYTLKPTLDNYTFEPPSRALTVQQASLTGQDFTAKASALCTLNGKATDTSTNPAKPLAATIHLDDGFHPALKVTANASDGTYRFENLPKGTYYVRAELSGYAFFQYDRRDFNSDTNAFDFTATPSTQLRTVSGTVSGASGTRVPMSLRGYTYMDILANPDGTYAFNGVNAAYPHTKDYTVQPDLAGYAAAPASTAVNLSQGNAEKVDFALKATPVVRRLYVKIQGLDRGEIAKVTLTKDKVVVGTASLHGQPSTFLGTYLFNNLPEGNYTLSFQVPFTYAKPADQEIALQNENKEVKVTLSQGNTTIGGTFQAQRNASLESLRVHIFKASDRNTLVTTCYAEADGRFKTSGAMEPGTYVLMPDNNTSVKELSCRYFTPPLLEVTVTSQAVENADFKVFPAPTTATIRKVWGTTLNTLRAVVGSNNVLSYNLSMNKWESEFGSGDSNDEFGDIHGTNANNVWVTSSMIVPGARDALKMYGSVWQRTENWNRRLKADDNSEAYCSVWTFGPNDTWVGGRRSTYHWNGSTWTAVAARLNDYSKGPLWGMDGTLWLIESGKLLRLNGAKNGWDDFAMPADAYATRIFGFSNQDFWISSSDILLHWTGSWATFPAGGSIYALWGRSSSNMWAAGDRGLLLHWDGSAWKKVETGTTTAIHALWGENDDEVWIGGDGLWRAFRRP